VGGEVTRIEVPKGRIGVHRYVTDEEIVELVRRLAAEFSDEQIARILYRKRLKTSKGLPFDAKRVTNLRYTHHISGHTKTTLPDEDVYTVQQAAERLGVTGNTVVRWIVRGLLKASQITSGAPWRALVRASDRQRLAASEAPQGWLALKGAAQALGVSQQTVVDKRQRGELEAVRVPVGARTAWRIRVDSVPSDIQMTLFD
jgi:excisionase family DNA binding protein